MPVRAGLSARGLLAPWELSLSQGLGGLIVVGSYVPRTTRQLQALLEEGAVRGIELPVEALLDETRRDAVIGQAACETEASLQRGEDVAVYTSRQLVAGSDAEASLAIGRSISAGLVALVRQIATRPRYLLAKGGITSSDLATRGLDIRRAMVLGQIHSGVPVWQLGSESRHPGLPYIVFPGNVGDDPALAEVVRRLHSAR